MWIARFFVAVALLGPIGCSNPQSEPERIADAFADAYFRRMDQEKAKEFTALGATKMLERELHDVAQIRKDGYTPDQAADEVTVKRGAPTQRDQRLRFPYEIVVKTPGNPDALRVADVELARIDGRWKVVRIGLSDEH